MRASDETPGVSGADRAAQGRDRAGSRRPSRKPAGWWGVRHARRAAVWGKAKYAGSWAESLWLRLDAVDFLNQAMLLAATLLLCIVPFLLIATALAGRVSWRKLYPCAVTTGAFWLAMLAVFSVIFSGMVISYDQKYGPIGVVFGLMSFFIAVGAVIILGAAVGLMWQDRGMSFRAAVRKLRRAS